LLSSQHKPKLNYEKITLFIFLFITTVSIAQEKETQYSQDLIQKQEVKLNAFNQIH